MRTKLIAGIAAVGAVLSVSWLVAAPAFAHHAFAAEFDGNLPVNLQGKVTRVEWINPHTWIHIDVKKPDGTTQAWMIEGGTPNTLLRRGITRDSIAIGTEIVVRGYQSKDKDCSTNNTCRANGRDVTFPDGRKLFMGSSGTGAPKDGADATEK